MVLPPTPIDPTKPFWEEISRVAIESVRYKAALENGENDHGPWVETPRTEDQKLSDAIYRETIDIMTMERLGSLGEAYLNRGYL